MTDGSRLKYTAWISNTGSLSVVSRTMFSVAALFFLAAPAGRADSCPTPDQVRNRKISRDYEWTVDEGITLKQLLAVTHLRAVAVENAGEFIACDYDVGKSGSLRLYAKPEGRLCVVTNASGHWSKSDEGDLLCKEKDPARCRFQFNCAGRSPEKTPARKE